MLDVGSDGTPAQGGVPPAVVRPTDDWFPQEGSCTPAGPTAKLVAEPATDRDVRGLVPGDGSLLFDAMETNSQAVIMHLGLVDVPSKAPPIEIPLEGFRGLAGILGDALVYVRTTHAGDGTKLDPLVEEVVLHDRNKSTQTIVPNPRTTTYVSAVAVHRSGVYWLSREWSATAPASISRWIPATSTATELTTLENHSSIVTDGADVYYVRWDRQAAGTIELRIEAVSAAGGVPRILRRMPYDAKLFYSVVAVDDQELYFTQQSTTNGGAIGAGDLRAMKKDGSGERVVASGQNFGPVSVRIDPDYLTWTDQDAQQTIVRVRRSGGAVERIAGAPEPNRWVSALAVDRCNMYWAVENPPAIYARSRLP